MKLNRKLVAGLTATGLVLSLVACGDKKHQSNAQEQGQSQTEQAFGQQSKAVPYPVSQLKDSQERRNLRERLLRQNNPNAVSYLYVLGGTTGEPIGYYVVKGKISSTQSQMTTDQLQVDACNRTGEDCPNAIDAPGDDGSYGPNEPGIFFFTAEGVMVQTDQGYIISDKPIAVGKFNVPKLS